MKSKRIVATREILSPNIAWTVAVAGAVFGCSGTVGDTRDGSGLSLGSPSATSGEKPGSTGLPPGSTVLENGTVVDSQGNIVGQVDDTGAVVSPNGDVVGVVNPDTGVANPDTTTDSAVITSNAPTIGCSPGVPGTTQLPLLTQKQYDNTIRDLMGINTQPSQMLAPDTGSVDQRAWDGYKAAAATLAPLAITDATARAMVVKCTPDTADSGAACASSVIADFGGRAFRRPLTADETSRFQAMFTNRATLTATGSFDEAIQLIVESMLLNPAFLARAETSQTPVGTNFALDDYEIASRLSYMLWGSMPDADLFSAAAAGTLTEPASILAQANRMLQDPKARSQVAAFHEGYAHMGQGTRWSDITRDPALFPAFNEGLIPVLSQETQSVFDHVVFDQGGSFSDLLTTNVAYVNATTAPLYGLDASQFGADLTAVELDASRPGIFTRLGFLTAYSGYNRTSPILRGAFIQKEVLCTVIPPPPAGAGQTALPDDPSLVTNRQKVDAQTKAPECANCHHTIVNPTGFALEGFDSIGAVQTMDSGAEIDTTATVPMGQVAAKVTGAADLMAAIAKSPEAQRCYAFKLTKFAYGREENAQDVCVVDGVATKLQAGGYSVLALLADLTQSENFRYRALETETAQ